jgi:hypothetical protein
MQEPLTVSIADAKLLTGLGHTTVFKLINEKKLETVKVGSRTLVVFKSLKALLQLETGQAA